MSDFNPFLKIMACINIPYNDSSVYVSAFQPFLSLGTLNGLLQCFAAPLGKNWPNITLNCNNWWHPWHLSEAH